MKRFKRLGILFFAIVLVLFGVQYKMKGDQNIQVAATFAKIQNLCNESAAKGLGEKFDKARSEKICTCFATQTVKQRSIAVANIVADPEMVQRILSYCWKSAK